jgi:hypothetical protein
MCFLHKVINEILIFKLVKIFGVAVLIQFHSEITFSLDHWYNQVFNINLLTKVTIIDRCKLPPITFIPEGKATVT